jgi:hypothetical protein
MIVNLIVLTLGTIIAGSFRSIQQMCDEFKRIHVDKDKSKGDSPGTPSMQEILMIPICAAVVLCSLYLSIQKFGKESVNKFMLVYFALSMTNQIKDILKAIIGVKKEEIAFKFNLEKVTNAFLNPLNL